MDRYKAREIVLKDDSISPLARLLYHILDDYQRANDSCWPHQKTLAKSLCCSVRTVQRLLLELDRAGYCTAVRTVSGGPNRYRLFHSYHTTRVSLPHDTGVATHTTRVSPHKAILTVKPENETFGASREDVRAALREYPRAQRLSGAPDDQIIDRVVSVSGSWAELADALRRMNAAGASPSQSWAWFPAVLANYCVARERRRA